MDKVGTCCFCHLRIYFCLGELNASGNAVVCRETHAYRKVGSDLGTHIFYGFNHHTCPVDYVATKLVGAPVHGG